MVIIDYGTDYGTKCDGSVIQRDSVVCTVCCEGNQYTRCHSGTCQGYQGIKLGG